MSLKNFNLDELNIFLLEKETSPYASSQLP